MSIYKLLIQILGQDAGASGTLRRVRGEVKQTESSVDLLKTAFQGLAVAGLLHTARRAADVIWELGNLGAEALQTEESFDLLAKRIGETGDSLTQTLGGDYTTVRHGGQIRVSSRSCNATVIHAQPAL